LSHTCDMHDLFVHLIPLLPLLVALYHAILKSSHICFLVTQLNVRILSPNFVHVVTVSTGSTVSHHGQVADQSRRDLS
jgi:hypothetical protein